MLPMTAPHPCSPVHVAPFDQYADGDGKLCQRGLDGEARQAWLAAVIAQHGLISVLAIDRAMTIAGKVAIAVLYSRIAPL